MYGEGWEFGEIAKWLGGDWRLGSPKLQEVEGNVWRINMKPGGKQLLIILWVLQMLSVVNFQYIKLEEVRGLCRGSFL